MKNKGYTLIELLGVMIILSLLIALVFPSIINFIKSSNEKKDNLTRDLVYNAAEMFIEDNASEYYSNQGSKYCISIDTLIENNYLKGDLEYQGQILDNTKSVRVTYTDKFNYEITDIDECTVCKLVDDADGSNSITVGDKYQCKVKDNMEEEFQDGYYFFVLSQDNSSTTNLIMERNIYYDTANDVGKVATESNKGLVAWYELEQNHSYGPLTAMNYLYNATKDWINIPNMIMNYIDEGNIGSNGYGGIKTTKGLTQIIQKDGSIVSVLADTDGYTNLKTRMPYKREISDYDNIKTTNAYLYDYLNLYSDSVQMNAISGIYGYWLLSSDADLFYRSWRVSFAGFLGSDHVSNIDGSGIRPVITISNSLISK